MQFNYDWWFGPGYERRIVEAKHRCARNHFPDVDVEQAEENPEYKTFFDQLEARTVLYLRDGFSYEVKEVIEDPCTSSMTFECMPAEESYKVGCFVVTIPFEDIIRVEIFAVHPQEKPEDMPAIKGFASSHGVPGPGRPDDRPVSRDVEDA